jgi:hypothetical protein
MRSVGGVKKHCGRERKTVKGKKDEGIRLKILSLSEDNMQCGFGAFICFKELPTFFSFFDDTPFQITTFR